ncbi:hypothetical protein [Streptococcus suis]|uniref:Uncharacterized protein n=1 Tax=Streptococcus suis TaxID=1307 RepID=A0A3R8TCI7_STRSU|nr:hypothetical protein [Streptococcus suis]MBY4965657.1 hypothetical protein [Streptococcus suis]MDW8778445.1 hypothetical protein [Streptococcus suis]RRN51156.1 hypothetical protein EI220_05175 [Streptococcus suis]RRR47824.1 hypothetical protein EJA00_07135 [Streptococcus suis]TII03202.1 hypothetical protein FAJ35_02665 [Streptococcus suis]
MSQIKYNNINQSEVTLSDLRQLGRQGGATARLDDGSDMTLRSDFGTVVRKAYIGGEVKVVDLIMNYPKIYPHIRTIARDGILIARRERVATKQVLKLTGRGYSRK